MNNEIKEILDNLGNKDNYIEEFGYQYKRINLYDSFQLLDYITNLQKENERLKEDIKFCINTMKNEYECTDKRTNRELHTMVEILEKWAKEYKEGSDNNEYRT